MAPPGTAAAPVPARPNSLGRLFVDVCAAVCKEGKLLREECTLEPRVFLALSSTFFLLCSLALSVLLAVLPGLILSSRSALCLTTVSGPSLPHTTHSSLTPSHDQCNPYLLPAHVQRHPLRPQPIHPYPSFPLSPFPFQDGTKAFVPPAAVTSIPGVSAMIKAARGTGPPSGRRSHGAGSGYSHIGRNENKPLKTPRAHPPVCWVS